MKRDLEFFDGLRKIALDRTRNIHSLEYRVIRDRIGRSGWTLEQALNTPQMTKSQAGHKAAKNPRWRNFTIKEHKDE